jgi:hypothetical protein
LVLFTHRDKISPALFERSDLLVSPQLFIGGAVAILCTAAVGYDQWFVHQTSKGRWMARTFGVRNAVWIWRFLLAAGATFGLCLAFGYVSPMTWNE